MSRTYRKPSSAAKRLYGKVDKVKDGTFTRAAHSCENHGTCSYCQSNRMHKHNKKLVDKINDYDDK